MNPTDAGEDKIADKKTIDPRKSKVKQDKSVLTEFNNSNHSLFSIPNMNE